MIIKYKDLCSTDFIFSDIVSYRMNFDGNDIYNYESTGRIKHLLFYQIENRRSYYIKDRHICTLGSGDILFLPHGVKYRSFIENCNEPTDGIGISFNLYTPTGELILLDEAIKFLANDNYGQYYKRFRKILYSVMNPTENILRLKGELYSIFDELFAARDRREDFKKSYGDIIDAINILENNPEKNLTTKELADMCLMSESSFLKKFKAYSGGIAPIKYRNNIRIMLAEELATSPLTINEIAEKLGFYDAAHLCRAYKQSKGDTLKKFATFNFLKTTN